jgi:hypothetical protein
MRRGPDAEWLGIYDELGWIPADVLERIAICVIDGGLSYRDAVHVANSEEQARGMNWWPGKHEGPGLVRAEPSMLAYTRKLAGQRE